MGRIHLQQQPGTPVGEPQWGLFDAANSYIQQSGNRRACTLKDWRAMADCQGPVFHVKGFKPPDDNWSFSGNEDALKNFRPIDRDDTGHLDLLSLLANQAESIIERYSPFGIANVIITAEPHVKGGGQFGGYSGPDGFAESLNAIRRVCSEIGVGTINNCGWESVQAWRDEKPHLQ